MKDVWGKSEKSRAMNLFQRRSEMDMEKDTLSQLGTVDGLLYVGKMMGANDDFQVFQGAESSLVFSEVIAKVQKLWSDFRAGDWNDRKLRFFKLYRNMALTCLVPHDLEDLKEFLELT